MSSSVRVAAGLEKRSLMTTLDRMMLPIAPRFVLGRLQARAAVELVQRHYEAAQGGRRTDGWKRTNRDANAAAGPAIAKLRGHVRDLVRNNSYAKRGKSIIGNNGVGWGIYAKPINAGARSLKNARAGYKAWAETTACDFDGLHNLYGLQRLALETIAEAGEVLIRRRRRPVSERLPIPLQLQVLEPDYIDTNKNGTPGQSGGRTVLGVEFNAAGKRAGYWLFEDHPGSSGLLMGRATGVSKFVPADEIIHLYRVDRPGQVRGVTWYAPVIVTLKDHDEFMDATLLRQKIAACFAAIVTDTGTAGSPLVGNPDRKEPLIEGIEPGMVSYLPPGKEITFSEPPGLTDTSYNNDVLARVAMGLNVTIEDLTGDYRNLPFSAAKMSRISHWASVHDWQYNILIPRGCSRIWDWAMEAMFLSGAITETPGSEWTPQPMPLIEADKEALAYLRAVRTGYLLPDDMIRERGLDPDTHWEEYGKQMKRIRERGGVLDIDASLRTQAGNAVNTKLDTTSGAEPPDTIDGG